MAWENVSNEFIVNTTRLMNTIELPMTSAKTESTIALENRLPIKVAFITLYALIFFFGITGNALVVSKSIRTFLSLVMKSNQSINQSLSLISVVVCRNKAMQTVTNVFITNLALSDILVCINLLHFINSNLISLFSFLFYSIFACRCAV